MRRKLPPFSTLQAFEAATRLGSFRSAADELNLTPGAISRQIRFLEDWRGVTLFERNGPKVELTEDGRDFLVRLEGPLNALHKAIYSESEGTIETIQVATLASIAKEWLIPRLPSFTDLHPCVRVIVHTDYALTRLAPRVAMVAIRHAVRTYNDKSCETLFDDQLIAVASPKVVKEFGTDPLFWPSRAVLHHLSLDAQAWIAAAGLTNEFTPQGPAFNDADVLLEAAQQGLGIALTRLSIAWRRLQAGDLVLACKVICSSPRTNLMIVREDCANIPVVQSFTNWVRKEAAQWKAVRSTFERKGAEF